MSNLLCSDSTSKCTDFEKMVIKNKFGTMAPKIYDKFIDNDFFIHYEKDTYEAIISIDSKDYADINLKARGMCYNKMLKLLEDIGPNNSLNIDAKSYYRKIVNEFTQDCIKGIESEYFSDLYEYLKNPKVAIDSIIPGFISAYMMHQNSNNEKLYATTNKILHVPVGRLGFYSDNKSIININNIGVFYLKNIDIATLLNGDIIKLQYKEDNRYEIHVGQFWKRGSKKNKI